MDTKSIDLGGLSMDKLFDKVIPGTIKDVSPTAKINIDMENSLFVLGFNIMCMEQENIGYDLENLNSNTLISIDKHNMIECIIMLSGAIYAVSMTNKTLNGSEDINISGCIRKFRDKLRHTIVYYYEIQKAARSLISYIKTTYYNDMEDNNIILLRLKYMAENIWFLPYSEIDKMKEKINDDLSGGEKNE